MDPHIMLLPGLLSNANLFAGQIPALSDISAVEVGDLTNDDTIGRMAASVLATASASRFVLMGLSLGGYVAFEIMRQAPERVTGLVLMDTTARPDTAEARSTREMLIGQARTDLGAVTEILLPRLSHPDKMNLPEVRGAIHSMAESLGKEVFERQQRAIMARLDSRPTLAEITCRTLVICGENDLITPPALSEEMTEGIKNARLEVIHQCGHLSTLDQPGEVNRLLIEWIRNAED